MRLKGNVALTFGQIACSSCLSIKFTHVNKERYDIFSRGTTFFLQFVINTKLD